MSTTEYIILTQEKQLRCYSYHRYQLNPLVWGSEFLMQRQKH
ncbi:hypothetical protein SynWH8103_00152 [Synechococcus sp. WH 8103]|nr:hypothetical protein SynWH8103_00152 [Synechococcus sp. WH 8103]